MVPHRIKYYPGVVLDVALATTIECDSTVSSEATPGLAVTSNPMGGPTKVPAKDTLLENPPTAPPPPSTATSDFTFSAIPSGPVLSPSSLLPDSILPPERTAPLSTLGSVINQQWFAPLLSNIQDHVQASFNLRRSITQAIQEDKIEGTDRLSELFMACSQGLQVSTAPLVELQEALESKQLQAINQWTQLKRRVQAILSQNEELHANPIPRLFIVLPQDSQRWHSKNPLSNTFRLYFLCECGEHTMSTNCRTCHHVHLAKHEGYNIVEPREFFQQYGTYVLAILKMIKFGISVAGVTVPPLSHLVGGSTIDQATTTLQLSTETIKLGMDQVIGCLEKIPTNNNEVVSVSTGQLESIMVPEGADLRDLESFLRNHDKGKVLGNLYRTLTTKGHVRWVCIDHYRKKHQEKPAIVLADVVTAFGGTFVENIGRVDVKLTSDSQANQFYRALEEAKAVYELEIDLYWSAAHSDIKILRDTLAKTDVGVLGLSLSYTCKSDLGSTNWLQYYNHIIDIMQLRSIQSFTINGIFEGFIQLFSALDPNTNFPNLRYLKVALWRDSLDIPGFKMLVEKAPNLSDLVVVNSLEDAPRIYSAIGYHSFPVNFENQMTRILPPKSGSWQPAEELQDLAQLYKFHGERIEKLRLFGYHVRESSIIDALAKGTEDCSRLKELTLWDTNLKMGENIRKLANIIARSELLHLRYFPSVQAICVHILEAIPWMSICRLEIPAQSGIQLVGVVKVLVDGIKKLSGRVVLQEFKLQSATGCTVCMALQELLQSFVGLTQLEHLDLDMRMTNNQILSLLESMDFSRLRHLVLRADKSEVDTLMGGLQDAAELQTLRLNGSFDYTVYHIVQTGDKNSIAKSEESEW